MSRSESVKRLANSRIVPEFWWWKWEDMKPFLGAALEAGEGAVIRAYPGLDIHGQPDIHFTIQKPGEKLDARDEDYNYSWLCPPVCPD